MRERIRRLVGIFDCPIRLYKKLRGKLLLGILLRRTQKLQGKKLSSRSDPLSCFGFQDGIRWRGALLPSVFQTRFLWIFSNRGKIIFLKKTSEKATTASAIIVRTRCEIATSAAIV